MTTTTTKGRSISEEEEEEERWEGQARRGRDGRDSQQGGEMEGTEKREEKKVTGENGWCRAEEMCRALGMDFHEQKGVGRR